MFFELRKRIHKPFKFFNSMADLIDFKELVEQHWSFCSAGSSLRTVWWHLMHAKEGLKQLRKKEFASIEEKLKEARQKLLDIQKLTTDGQHPNLKEDEKDLKIQYEEWAKVEKSVIRQKSRVQWLKMGDSNSTYFFANMKSRVAQNKITQLTNDRNMQILQTIIRVQYKLTTSNSLWCDERWAHSTDRPAN
ncbi:uncharacterized protein LOC132066452 [Lycium ferocissimum]|uniref:uncharacterized protein LOC132066452 n=1 Tax=Lycium ferocissimum TaxID=112874 RepID=UPI002815E1E3|nr:uncharacterized protein LOC132066452 [Lycium ferocissimum]